MLALCQCSNIKTKPISCPRAQHNSNLYSLKTDSCWRREQSITQNLCSFLSLFSTWHSVFSIGLTIFVATLATPFLTTLMLRTRLLPRKSLLKIFFFSQDVKNGFNTRFCISQVNCTYQLCRSFGNYSLPRTHWSNWNKLLQTYQYKHCQTVQCNLQYVIIWKNN